MKAFGLNGNSLLSYSILYEENVHENGWYSNKSSNFSYMIDKLSGRLQFQPQFYTSGLINIVVAVQVLDNSKFGVASTQCNLDVLGCALNAFLKKFSFSKAL